MTEDKNGAKKALYRFDKNYPLKEKLLPGSSLFRCDVATAPHDQGEAAALDKKIKVVKSVLEFVNKVRPL